MIRHGGHEVPGFALGSERADRIRAALRAVMGEVQRLTHGLTPREVTILRLGLEASHLEESVAHADWSRAEAHTESLVKLLDQLGG